jgi:MFS transporter, ACS family, glucarate transporter
MPTELQSTHSRHRVVFFAMALSVITYIDRVAISQAAPLISESLGLTKVQMGLAFSAFGIAYGLTQVPGGWMSDWKGPRRVLTFIVVFWSLFTAATGWVWNHISLVAVRFLFGAGQGGCFPALTSALTVWLPNRERVRAQGLMWMSARWGGAFAPLLVAALMQFMSWRRVFEILGLIGVLWAVCFWRWCGDEPFRHPGPNPTGRTGLKEATGSAGVPWKRFFRSTTFWLLCTQYFCEAFGWFFYITWLPTYLHEARGQTLERSALLSALPLLFGGLGSLLCGLVLRRVESRLNSVRTGRRLVAAVGLSGAGALLVVSVHTADPVQAMLVMGLASFCNDLAIPPAWAACMDVGGKYVGSLSGSMNAAASIAGWLAPLLVALILASTNENWEFTFYVSAVVYFIGALCWLFIDPVTPLDNLEVTRQ